MIEPKTELIQVWLVEDNEAFCRDVQRVVNGLGGKTCDIKIGSAGASVGASKNDTAPDVVLLNVQLPGVDGIAALSEHVPGDLRGQEVTGGDHASGTNFGIEALAFENRLGLGADHQRQAEQGAGDQQR